MNNIKTCSYRTENKLKKHKKVCENHDYCYVEMPEEDNKILKYNHGGKFMKVPFSFMLTCISKTFVIYVKKI